MLKIREVLDEGNSKCSYAVELQAYGNVEDGREF